MCIRDRNNVFQWTITGAAPCGATSSQVTIATTAGPAMTSANSAAICSGATLNILLTSDIPATYSWIATDNPNTTGESLSTQTNAVLNNVLINTTSTFQNVTYSVTPVSIAGNCPGTPQSVVVRVNPN